MLGWQGKLQIEDFPQAKVECQLLPFRLCHGGGIELLAGDCQRRVDLLPSQFVSMQCQVGDSGQLQRFQSMWMAGRQKIFRTLWKSSPCKK